MHRNWTCCLVVAEANYYTFMSYASASVAVLQNCFTMVGSWTSIIAVTDQITTMHFSSMVYVASFLFSVLTLLLSSTVIWPCHRMSNRRPFSLVQWALLSIHPDSLSWFDRLLMSVWSLGCFASSWGFPTLGRSSACLLGLEPEWYVSNLSFFDWYAYRLLDRSLAWSTEHWGCRFFQCLGKDGN